MKAATRPLAVSPRPARWIALSDVPAVAALMLAAYRGTIDEEEETLEECEAEVRGTLTGKYGPFMAEASFLIEEDGLVLSASLLTFFKERPLLAFSMTRPEAQGRGLARHLIERSLDALHRAGRPELFLAVTEGNAPAQRLYAKLGFTVCDKP